MIIALQTNDGNIVFIDIQVFRFGIIGINIGEAC